MMAMLVAMPCACGKGPGGAAKKIPRDKDAQAVVVMEAPGDPSISFTDESEPNGELAHASPLAVGQGARGSLDGDTDVDLYRVRVASPGILAARLSGIEGVDLMLDLQDAEGKLLARSDRGPAQIVEGIANYPVDKGDYLLAVREFVKKKPSNSKKRGKGSKEPAEEPGRVGPSPPYELSAQLSPAAEPRYELEPNDSTERASEVLVGDEMVGFLGWARDVDIWRLSVEGFAAHYGMDLDIEGVSGVAIQLDMSDERGARVLSRQGREGEPLSVRNLVVVPDEATAGLAEQGSEDAPRYYYAKLSARRSNPLEPYRLRMATRLLDLDEETEPNDSPQGAMTMRESLAAQQGVLRGSLTTGDVDHYKVVVGSEPILLSVTARPSAGLSATIDLGIEVGTEGDATPLGTANRSKAGGEESLADLRMEAGKTAIIKIAGQGSSGTDSAYELRWSLEPARGLSLEDDESGTDDLGLTDEYE